ncbi:JAB1/Mov34/MPN/PAD-1 ubiquitin protease-domain-containing protein [Tirmania nivea]|nr:JAB1/Mov34/MPN/PAD-1 ubiquitin protease-domain-containing protein [Tirmania nivea]
MSTQPHSVSNFTTLGYITILRTWATSVKLATKYRRQVRELPYPATFEACPYQQATMDASASARKTFELENNVQLVADPVKDGIYAYDNNEQIALSETKPWRKDPTYFKKVRISAVALLKMVMHARSGGSIEVMGLMQGKVANNTIIVMDAYPLPVEGTETRVNAHEAAYEYMAQYDSLKVALKRPDNVVGWYHSHPGYGCWLSGIDVGTQMMQQAFCDPFLAIVVDPNRTISAGKVDIGAFRTYPEGYKSKDSQDSEYQTIPLSKIEDFGAHSSQYYPLVIEHFKSSLDEKLLDLLWNKYWVSTLAQSPLFTNRDYSSKQMLDLAAKIKKTEHSISLRATDRLLMTGSGGGVGGGGGGAGHTIASRKEGGNAAALAAAPAVRDTQLDNIVRDSNKIASEEITGLLASVVKDRVFNGVKVERAGG